MKKIVLISLLMLVLAFAGCKTTGKAFEFQSGEDHTIYNLLDDLDPSQVQLVLDSDEESSQVVEEISSFAGTYNLPNFIEEDDPAADPSNGNRIYFSSYDGNTYSNDIVSNMLNDEWNYPDTAATAVVDESGGAINLIVVWNDEQEFLNAMDELTASGLSSSLQVDCAVFDGGQISECLYPCSDLGGTICNTGQACSGGSFEESLEGSNCCVGGTCEDRIEVTRNFPSASFQETVESSYTLNVQVDMNNAPDSFYVEEILPAGWELSSSSIEPALNKELDDGSTKLQWFFGPSVNSVQSETIIDLNVIPAADALEFEGSWQVSADESGSIVGDTTANVETCTCTEWANEGCGLSDCGDEMMLQMRDCSISGCRTTKRCVENDECLMECQDDDGDGYGAAGTDLRNCPASDTLEDCDDDASDDPAACSSGDCGDLEHSECARCIHPGATEYCNDGIDNDCDSSTSDTDEEQCLYELNEMSLRGNMEILQGRSKGQKNSATLIGESGKDKRISINVNGKLGIPETYSASSIEDICSELGDSVDIIWSVGGPCANPVTDNVYGGPADCAAPFEQNTAHIRVENVDLCGSQRRVITISGEDYLRTRLVGNMLVHMDEFKHKFDNQRITIDGSGVIGWQWGDPAEIPVQRGVPS